MLKGERMYQKNVVFLLIFGSYHCFRGEMFDYIVAQRRVPEVQACKFFHQLIDGLEVLHKNEITHRDLKPEVLKLKHFLRSIIAMKLIKTYYILLVFFSA